jgi:hypothetical protein
MIVLKTISSNGTATDITSYTGSYSLSDNIDSLGAEFQFKLMSNPLDANYQGKELPIGTKVVFFLDGSKMFSGVVVSYSRNSLTEYSYKCFDYAFYLNKSEAQIQFNNISTTNAIKKLCAENAVPVGNVCEIPTMVNKIYQGNPISDIIKDLLKMAEDEQKMHYRLEVRDTALYIEPYKDLYVRGEFTDIVGDFNSSYSIEDMANRIVIVSSSEKNQQIVAEKSDAGSIRTYGQITKIEKVEDKKMSQAAEIAANKLLDKNSVKRSFSVTLLGSGAVRAGRMVVFSQPEINLTGAFLVKNCTHNFDGNKHTMKLDLEV